MWENRVPLTSKSRLSLPILPQVRRPLPSCSFLSLDKNGGHLKQHIHGRKFILWCCTLIFAKHGHTSLYSVCALRYARARAPMLYHRILVKIWHQAELEIFFGQCAVCVIFWRARRLWSNIYGTNQISMTAGLIVLECYGIAWEWIHAVWFIRDMP